MITLTSGALALLSALSMVAGDFEFALYAMLGAIWAEIKTKWS